MVCLPVSSIIRFNISDTFMFTTIGESQVNHFGHWKDNFLLVAVLLTNDKWWNRHIV